MIGTVGDVAQRVGGRAIGDAGVLIERVAAIEDAEPDTLTFATTKKYLDAALASAAAAILLEEALAVEIQTGKPLIIVASTRAALAALLRELEPRRKAEPYRHSSAAVDESARIGSDVYIGAHVVIEAQAQIGDRAILEAGVYVGRAAEIGEDALLHPHAAVLEHCRVGARSILHPGAVVGSQGFGFAQVDGRLQRIPQVGNVVIESDVEIGANTCVDRAQTGSTRIGQGTKIDNLCQIGHNCRIGSNTAMAAQTGLAGTTTIGDNVMIGGQAGFKGHLTVGSGVTIGAGAKVWGDIADGAFVSGIPARPHHEELRREVMLRNLPKLASRVDALEKRNG